MTKKFILMCINQLIYQQKYRKYPLPPNSRRRKNGKLTIKDMIFIRFNGDNSSNISIFATKYT